MTLYLKYRPQTIDDLDLVAVRESLGKMLGSKNLPAGRQDIPHAWLFSGPRGTGKTSAARVLAKVVNKDEQVLNSPDIVEIDAASNRGIEEIRTLREGVGLAPISAKIKVYIIDEVHMLTTEAANALLKTLEEPPAHVMFVLCTTDPGKLPETVVSRCTRVQFNKPTLEEAVSSLAKVVKGEKLKISKEDLELVAREARGSFRDGTKILEQIITSGEDVRSVLKMQASAEPDIFLDLVAKKDIEELLKFINALVEGGVSIRTFLERLIMRLRDELLDSKNTQIIETIEELEKVYVRTKEAAVEQLPLEMFVIEQCGTPNAQGSILNAQKTEISASEPVVVEKKIQPSGNYKLEDVVLKWKDVLAAVRPMNHSVEALLRSTKPADFDGHTLNLEVFYKFHKDKLETDKCRKIVEDGVASVFGMQSVVVKMQLGTRQEPPSSEDLAKIAEGIFK
ncbi:MAG: polymerase III, subunit gamma and tau protein [Candidatus Amesbacteria bacterium GW2011_GWA2_42_12]|uniref:DNA polymerase III subunit gamma/tau n=1 Tax=Candidatus Amesbacteria bacterium GW2011_GWA2_42_12 TaxID=1618356 RepID=A0A0G1B670_9BACT|nr:MAG: polymerase III, subunit gamma and tau protein [Candidatus Amesbacteria bacterium GW2011_GWA2_42_12]